MSESNVNNHFLIVDSRCFEQKLSPIEAMAYFRICMRAHKSVCFESAQHIANACNTSLRSIMYALSKLKSLNMIEIHSGRTKGETNHIKLVPYENWMRVQTEVCTPCTPSIQGMHPMHTPYALPAHQVSTRCIHNSTQFNRTQKQDPSLSRTREESREKTEEKQKRMKGIGISLSLAIRRAHKRQFFDNSTAAQIVSKVVELGMEIENLIDIIDEIERDSFLTSLRPADIIHAIVSRPASKSAQISTIEPPTIQSQPEAQKIEQKPNISLSKPNPENVKKMTETDSSGLPSNFRSWLAALPRREQVALNREIQTLGVEIFLTHRLPALHGYRYAAIG